MTTAPQTPAPWTCRRAPDDDTKWWIDAAPQNEGATIGAPVAEVRDYNDDGQNARIMMAAPDMLEALKALMDISKSDDWNGSAQLDTALENARAAIALAT